MHYSCRVQSQLFPIPKFVQFLFSQKYFVTIFFLLSLEFFSFFLSFFFYWSFSARKRSWFKKTNLYDLKQKQIYTSSKPTHISIPAFSGLRKNPSKVKHFSRLSKTMHKACDLSRVGYRAASIGKECHNFTSVLGPQWQVTIFFVYLLLYHLLL